MRRRDFIALLGGAAAAWPVGGRAEQARKVAWIAPTAGPPGPLARAFTETLGQLGWVTGQNLTIEYRFSGGRQDTIAAVVEEVVGLGVDVIVAWGPLLSLAAKQKAPQIPLVFLIVFDPVDVGLVTSISRPGGNVTGITGLASLEIFAKRLQLLKETVPSLARVAVLLSTEQTRSDRGKQALMTAAKALQLELSDLPVERPSDLEPAIHRAKELGSQAVYAWPSGLTYSFVEQISDSAIAARLPSIHSFREGAVGGGLLAYAVDLKEQTRRGAAYVNRILRGTPPGNLPVEQMSKYELLINLRTAKALGLEIPPTLLARADEVIE